MKLLTYEYEGKERVGVLSECGKYVCEAKSIGLPYDTMLDIVKNVDQATIRSLKGKFDKDSAVSVDDIKWLAPIPRPEHDIMCLGVNFKDHAEEGKNADGGKGAEIKLDYATYFAKRADYVIGPGAAIDSHKEILPEGADYEVELAVIYGKDCKDIAPEDVYDHIFGYTICNDVSARSFQFRHNQWWFAKSFDTFTVMGPVIVTEDEFTRPIEVSLKSYVNGELRQDSNTKLYLHDIVEVTCELSKGLTIKAGDILSTGTPAGVGMGFKPPKLMKPGDVCELVIDGIGSLKNPII